MNGTVAYALGMELAKVLVGTRIRDVSRYHGGLTFALDSASIPFIHVFFTGREADLAITEEPVIPPATCTRVFDQLSGARISEIRPLGLDRVILVDVEAEGRWEEPEAFLLRLDLTPGGKAVSLFRMPDRRLISSFGAARTRTPSSPDDLPPHRRWSLLSLPADPPSEIIRILDERAEGGEPFPDGSRSGFKRLSETILGTVAGTDPVLAKALSKLSKGDPYRCWESLSQIAVSISSGSFDWAVYDLVEAGAAGRCAVYPVKIPFTSRPEIPGGFVGAVVARSMEVVVPEYIGALRRAAASRVKRQIKRAERLIENITRDLEDAQRSDQFRHYGNLLVTHRHRIKTGMKEARLKDFSGDRMVTIPLDPALDREANIRKYFRMAKKGEKGLMVIKSRLIEIKRRAKEDRRVLEEIRSADSPDFLIGLMPAERGRSERREKDQKGESTFRRYRIDERHTVLVGRNDAENDFLTHRYAAPGDLWFHAQGIPGSHVILRGADRSTPRRVVEIAAAAAAWFSKARGSKTVPVIYTEKRYVRRPRRSRPGTAVCEREKTIFVSPSLPDDPEDS